MRFYLEFSGVPGTFTGENAPNSEFHPILEWEWFDFQFRGISMAALEVM